MKFLSIACLVIFSSCSYAANFYYSIAPGGALGTQINAAIAERNANSPGDKLVIQLSSGVYQLSGCNDFCITIGDEANVTIEGQGPKNTKLLVAGSDGVRKGVFRVYGSESISISGLAIDYEYKPFFQGEVTYINDREDGRLVFSVKQMGTNQPSASQLLDSSGFGIIYDPNNLGVRKKNTGTYLPEKGGDLNIAYNSSNNRWYFNYPASSWNANFKEWVSVGDHFVFTQRIAANAMYFSSTDGITVQNVDIHASPGSGIKGVINAGQQTFENINMVPSSGYILSSNADGMHHQDSSGPIIVRNSTFKSTGDDGLAIYTEGMKMTSIGNAPNIVVIDKYIKKIEDGEEKTVSDFVKNLKRVKVGDVLQFVDTANKSLVLNSGVVSISSDATSYYFELASPLQEKLEPNSEVSVFNLSLDGHYSEIDGNTFDSIRRAGVNIKSRHVDITNNTFINVDVWGIAAHIESSALTSGSIAYGHTITGNVFTGTSGPRTWDGGAIPTNIRVGLFPTGKTASQKLMYDKNLLDNVISGNSYLNNFSVNLIEGAYTRG